MYTLRLLNITGSSVVATLHDAKLVSFSKRINGPGRLVYKLPAGSRNASITRLQKYQRVRLDRRKQDGTDQDEAVWYGYVEAHKREDPAEYTVYCAGMLQLFAHRYTAKDEAFTGQGSTEAFGLLSDTNANDGDTGIVSGSGGVTTTRDVKATGRKDVLSMWGDLADAHKAEFEITDAGVFNFVQSLGSDKTGTSLVLRYRTDEPGSTVERLAEGEDGGPIRNKVIGTNSDGTLTSIKQDAASQAKYGVLVEVKVFPEAQDQTTLDALTQAHLDQVKEGVPDFGTRPIMAERKPGVISGSLATQGFQFGAVVPGDLLRCDLVSESQTVQANKRVVEIMVDVDENLKERVQYTLGEPGVFVSVTSLGNTAADDVQMRLLRLEQGGAGGGGGGGSTGFVDRQTPTGAIDGSNVSFTLASTPVAGSEHVYLDGQLLTSGVDYTISGAGITLTTAPAAGSKLVVSYRTSNGTFTFSDKETPSGAIDGSNAAFTLAHTPTGGSEYVWLNGFLQTSGTDYTLAAATVTFAVPPTPGDVIRVSYRY